MPIFLSLISARMTSQCTFHCNWFHSYRRSCLDSPCLAVGNSCEVAGAPNGADCGSWCCIYEPVRGLIFLLPALVLTILVVVVGRCIHRRQVLRKREQQACALNPKIEPPPGVIFVVDEGEAPQSSQPKVLNIEPVFVAHNAPSGGSSPRPLRPPTEADSEAQQRTPRMRWYS